MKNKIIFAILVFGLLGCSNQELNSKIDRDVASEKSVEKGAPTSEAIVDIINESTSLTTLQKERILALQGRMSAYLQAKQEEMGRLKLTFMRSILNRNTSSQEIALLRRRIIDLNHDKMTKILKGMEEAKEILGLVTIRDERIYRAFVFDHDRPFN